MTLPIVRVASCCRRPGAVDSWEPQIIEHDYVIEDLELIYKQ